MLREMLRQEAEQDCMWTEDRCQKLAIWDAKDRKRKSDEAAEEQAMVEQEFADALPFVAEALGYFLVVLAAALVPTVLFQYDLCLLSDYDLLSDAKRLCGVG